MENDSTLSSLSESPMTSITVTSKVTCTQSRDKLLLENNFTKYLDPTFGDEEMEDIINKASSSFEHPIEKKDPQEQKNIGIQQYQQHNKY